MIRLNWTATEDHCKTYTREEWEAFVAGLSDQLDPGNLDSVLIFLQNMAAGAIALEAITDWDTLQNLDGVSAIALAKTPDEPVEE